MGNKTRQKIVLSGLMLFFCLIRPALAAEWVSLSQGLDEFDIRAVVVHPRDSQMIFAASERHVYKTTDGGRVWKQVLGLRGTDSRVNCLTIHPLHPGTVYAGTSRGIYRSQDSGKRWKPVLSGVGDDDKNILCMEASRREPALLWVGTSSGLFSFNTVGGSFQKAEGFPRSQVYSILLDAATPDLFVTTSDGIYRSNSDATHWQRVFVQQSVSKEDSAPATETTRLEQFNIEELQTMPQFSNLIFLSNQNKFYAASPKGILEASVHGDGWRPLEGQNLPGRRINFLAQSPGTFYAATDEGIYQWDRPSGSFREIYKGLVSKEVNTLFYDAGGDALLAGTKRGLFRYAHPEFYFPAPGGREVPAKSTDEILNLFKGEPTIREIQEATIRYAEVHPSKIEEWRKAASRRAFLPTLSVNTGLDRNENIDLDRGGTGDPDRFIQGPDERSFDWSVGLNWNLGEMIWNDDQTSIDTRSRLMVELRDDVLDEVTHLYYERRRLQVEMALSPPGDVPLQVEKRLRLEELTASIDALTGGYLSKHLSSH